MLDLLPDDGLGIIILANRFPSDSFLALRNPLVDAILGLPPGAHVLPAVAPPLARVRGAVHQPALWSVTRNCWG